MSFIQETLHCKTHDRYINIALGTFGVGYPKRCKEDREDCEFEQVADGWWADEEGKLRDKALGDL